MNPSTSSPPREATRSGFCRSPDAAGSRAGQHRLPDARNDRKECAARPASARFQPLRPIASMSAFLQQILLVEPDCVLGQVITSPKITRRQLIKNL